MNEKLKKSVRKQQEYQQRYMKNKVMLSVLLDKKKDADIIDWLNQQICKTESVKRALREDIAYEEQTKTPD